MLCCHTANPTSFGCDMNSSHPCHHYQMFNTSSSATRRAAERRVWRTPLTLQMPANALRVSLWRGWQCNSAHHFHGNGTLSNKSFLRGWNTSSKTYLWLQLRQSEKLGILNFVLEPHQSKHKLRVLLYNWKGDRKTIQKISMSNILHDIKFIDR